MSGSSGCCCGAVETCTDCFYGRDADTLCCRLSDKDVLMYNNPRPAGSKPVYLIPANCDCPVSEGSLSWNASVDIIVRYNHEPGDTAEQTSYKWFYDNGSFGTAGSNGNTTLDGVRCGLFPVSESACCSDNPTPGDATGWFGPSKANLCYTSSGTFGQLSTLQKSCIRQGEPSAPSMTQNLITGTCEDGSALPSYRRVCPCAGSDQFSWLLDIANNTDGEVYRHWYWNTAGSGSVAEDANLCRLSQTLVAVFHSEMWYRACEKYPPSISDSVTPTGGSQDDKNAEANGSTWRCRVPEWWIYACSGVPVFSWEIGLMEENGIISSAEMTYFFQQISENKPIGETAVGNALLQKLMTKTWNTSAPAGVGILQTKDWAGYTKNDGSVVPDTERRIVRKDLSKWSQIGGTPVNQVIEHDQFFYGRNGGWTHVCRTPKNVAFDVTANIPQVPRGVGFRDGIDPCRAAGTDGSCLTAAALPYGTTTCTSVTTSCGCNVCDYLDANDNPQIPFPGCTGWINAGCNLGVNAGCDPLENPELCQGTRFAASCGGVHFQFSGYRANSEAEADEPPFSCQETTHSHLWILNRTCDESDDTAPKQCTSPGCPPAAYDGFDGVTHLTNPFVTRSVRRGVCDGTGATEDNTFCDGGIGTVKVGREVCEITVPVKRADATKGDPGPAMKPPYTSGTKCGTFLCNEKGPGTLGACCKTEGGVTTCLDAVTAEQCENCNSESGVTAVWKGPNSCCENNPC